MLVPSELASLLRHAPVVMDNARRPLVSATEAAPSLPALCPWTAPAKCSGIQKKCRWESTHQNQSRNPQKHNSHLPVLPTRPPPSPVVLADSPTAKMSAFGGRSPPPILIVPLSHALLLSTSGSGGGGVSSTKTNVNTIFAAACRDRRPMAPRRFPCNGTTTDVFTALDEVMSLTHHMCLHHGIHHSERGAPGSCIACQSSQYDSCLLK